MGGHRRLTGFLTDPATVLTRFEHAVTHAAPLYGPLCALGIAIVSAGYLVVRGRIRAARHAAYVDGARVITVLAPPKVDARGAEAFWSHLLGLLRPPRTRFWSGQPHLAFEYAWSRAGLQVRIWVPGIVPPLMIERAIVAAWPGAQTRTEDATDAATRLLPTQARAIGGRMVLAKSEVLPLETKHDADPLRPLLSACSGLGVGEYAAVQLLARPVTGRRARTARRQVAALRGGGSGFGPLGALLDLITPGTKARARAGHRAGKAVVLDPAQVAAYRAASVKSASALWDVRLSYAAASTIAGEHEDSPRLRGRAHQIASAFSVYSGANWMARKRLPAAGQVLASRAFHGRGYLLSAGELGALAHLPTDPGAPGLERAGAASISPPPGIQAPDTSAGIKPIGITDAGVKRPVGLAVADARHHLHVMGATGSGKSTLMTNLVLDDVEAGRGVVVVDPKGDMIEDILARLPKRVADRTVLFDADDIKAPPRLNVLQCETVEDRDMVVDNVTGIFSKIFSGFWGPRTDDVFRNACLTLLHHDPTGGSDLGDVAAMLTDRVKRDRATAGIKDEVLQGFWADYDAWTDAHRATVIGPLMNKLRAFLTRSFVRNSIASGASSFDIGDVLDGGLCLVRIPKGVLGEQTAQLLGSLVVAKTWQGASRRARLAQHQRVDAGLYLDECQNFLSLPYPMEDMLAEARGYRLSLTLAHQNLAQLPRDLREGVSANARSKVFFNASPEDSRDLERHTSPLLVAHDLSHLGVYQAAARLVSRGEERSAFTLTTIPLPPEIPGRAQLVRERSREVFGRAPATPDDLPHTNTTPVGADPRD
ncbi:type IV secretory system conjugative DNA transfer family protein [Actinospica robiniae]|uniref:type IV secretory system conjugative DNA transfer family protein n=1 Tax=Actinospica robiniae TaxID=304901 RepID=UPI000423DA7C|nr:type IV secretory system conjugative DNA transfer family protein [Actinospica robiniae]